jgi:hypothetical protein
MNYLKKVVMVLFAALFVMLGFTEQSYAALDASVSTAFAAIQTDATSLNAIVVPILIAILGMVILIKLYKRFGNKI